MNQRNNIQKERIRKGLTQNELSELVGITRSAIQKIETGRRKPSYKVLMRLEEIFTPLDYKYLMASQDSDSLKRF